jgi:hypothetical protein
VVEQSKIQEMHVARQPESEYYCAKSVGVAAVLRRLRKSQELGAPKKEVSRVKSSQWRTREGMSNGVPCHDLEEIGTTDGRSPRHG